MSVHPETIPLKSDSQNKECVDFIHQMHDIMESHLEDDFDIRWVCQGVAMSRTQVYRRFKTLTDLTVAQYFRWLRLRKAKELLASLDIKVSEAAYMTGFKNLSHFSRVFTAEFGINPSQISK